MLLLLHEVGDDALGLSQVLHRKASDLVHAHDLRHGGEDKNGIEVVSSGLDDLDNLLGKLLDEDERSDKNVSIFHILLELCVGIVISEFL